MARVGVQPRDRDPGTLSVPQLRSYNTNFVWQQYQLVDPVIPTVLNLVGVDSRPLDLRYSNSARYTVEACLPTNVYWIFTGISALREDYRRP